MSEKRTLTHREEELIRLVHHDFGGKTVKEAADIMNVSTSRAYDLLKSLKRKAPQLFPILSPREALVVKLLTEKGLSVDQIALASGSPAQAVRDVMCRVRKKGFKIPPPPKPVRYTDNMDSKVKEKF